MDFNAIWARVQRAIRLEPGVYSEIGGDQKATGEALVVAIGASLISGLGSILPGGAEFGFGPWIFGGVVGVPIGLAIGTGILWLVSRLFGARGEYIHLFRGLGYASAPQALGFVPLIGIVGSIWSLVLAIRAVRETQSVSDGQAIAIVLIPVVISVILFVLIAAAAFVAFLGFADS
jgi:hypothetical protein